MLTLTSVLSKWQSETKGGPDDLLHNGVPLMDFRGSENLKYASRIVECGENAGVTVQSAIKTKA